MIRKLPHLIFALALPGFAALGFALPVFAVGQPGLEWTCGSVSAGGLAPIQCTAPCLGADGVEVVHTHVCSPDSVGRLPLETLPERCEVQAQMENANVKCFPPSPPPVIEIPEEPDMPMVVVTMTASMPMVTMTMTASVNVGPETGGGVGNSGGSNGGGNSGALVAGAVAIGVVAIWGLLDLTPPDGATFQPTANYAFRDGSGFAGAGVHGSWRSWDFSASSGNAGHGWTKPHMRVRWTWAF